MTHVTIERFQNLKIQANIFNAMNLLCNNNWRIVGGFYEKRAHLNHLFFLRGFTLKTSSIKILGSAAKKKLVFLLFVFFEHLHRVSHLIGRLIVADL